MTPTETAAKLRVFNDWRRGELDDLSMPDPREIGEAIDAAVEMIDRLEAAESDALEQARMNGMGASREAALMAKLESAERDIALKEMVIDALGSTLNAVANERDALLARIEAMVADGLQQAPSVPDGWKLVPIEPTPEMMKAMVSHYKQLGVAWHKALKAAPEAKP